MDLSRRVIRGVPEAQRGEVSYRWRAYLCMTRRRSSNVAEGMRNELMLEYKRLSAFQEKKTKGQPSKAVKVACPR